MTKIQLLAFVCVTVLVTTGCTWMTGTETTEPSEEQSAEQTEQQGDTKDSKTPPVVEVQRHDAMMQRHDAMMQ